MEFIVITSTFLQFYAGFLALKLISETEKGWAWILLSAGIFAMAFRRSHTLFEIYQSGNVPTLPYELLGLAISIMLFAGLYLIAPMIQAMRTASERIAESEERYRTVANFTYDWEYWLRPDGRFAYVSPSCERITGYTADEFLKDPKLFESIIHPEHREQVQRDNVTMAKLLKPLTYDAKIIDKHGTEHWIACNSLPVYSSGGVFLGIRASIRIIDHRKTLEAELKSSRLLYVNLVQNSPCLVFRLNSAGIITFVNRYAIDLFRYTRDGLVGSHINDIFIREESDQSSTVAKLIEESLVSGKRIDFEYEHLKNDGSFFWGEWVNSAVRDEFGKIIEFACVGIDVTRRKALDKLKDDVSRIIRHDLKSPLSGIIGIPRVLRRDENITPRQAELLHAVEEAGIIMLDLINRSLDLYKLETGTYQFDFTEFDLVAMVRDVVQHIQIGKNKDILVQVVLDGREVADGNSIMISGERSLIFSMLGNLIRNAVEASDDNPISIAIDTGTNCTIRICNLGVVPECIRDSFFEKYVTEGKSGGTGLGTYSARLIAEEHGGSISMVSSQEEGTTVVVTLPFKHGDSA